MIEIKAQLNRAILYSQIGRLIFSRCQFFLTWSCRFNTIPVKIQQGTLCLYRQMDFKVCMEEAKTQNSQHNTEGEEQVGVLTRLALKL